MDAYSDRNGDANADGYAAAASTTGSRGIAATGAAIGPAARRDEPTTPAACPLSNGGACQPTTERELRSIAGDTSKETR